MEQNPQVEYQEYKEPVNYILAIIGALGGAAIGVGIWAITAYLGSFYYFVPVVVGGLAGAGATTLGRGHNFAVGLIALVITVVALALADGLETAIILEDFSLTIDDYIRAAQLKFDEDIIQYIMYLVGLGAALLIGIVGANRNEA